MKKLSLILSSTLIIIILFTGCGINKPDSQVKSSKQNNTNRNTQESTQNSKAETQSKDGDIKSNSAVDSKQSKTITESDAEQIVKNIKGKLPENYSLIFENMEERDGKKYFIIHGIESVIDNPATGEGHGSTFGWYMVDKETGEAYEWNLDTDKLTPLK